MDTATLRQVVRNISVFGVILAYLGIGLIAAMAWSSLDTRLSWILFAVAVLLLGTGLRLVARVLRELVDRIPNAADSPTGP